MQIVKASSELFPIIKGQNDILKMIEKAGRTCYKSEDKITDDSAIKFVQGTIFKRGHESVVEHGAIVVSVDDETYSAFKEIMPTYQIESYNPNRKHFNMTCSTNGYIISGNVRAWRDLYRFRDNFQTIDLSLLHKNVAINFKELFYDLYISESKNDEHLAHEEMFNDKHTLFKQDRYKIIDDFSNFSLTEQLAHIYRTVRVITNRGVTHEFVRNRDLSFSQESTRYVNYVARDDYSGSLRFIDPRLGMMLNKKMNKLTNIQLQDLYDEWQNDMIYCENAYNSKIEKGATPEIARGVLPNDLKTEIIMTTNMQGWNYFLRQRTAPVVHPQAHESSIPILLDMQKEYEFMKEIKPEQRDIDLILSNVA